MAVKLIHKHSNNAYTNASSTDLEFGEIAVNNHETGPYLQVKGTDGNVYEVGGIYYNTHAPTNPLKGKFWLDQTTDQLRVWNGTAWIICAGVSGPTGPGFTGGSYDPSTGQITFTSDDGIGFSTGDLRGADGADGSGFTGASYDSATGRITFTSDDGLGFITGDLRGADGADGADGDGFTGGSYDSTTGEVTFTSNDGLGFSTGNLRGAAGAQGPQGVAGEDGDGFTGGYYSPTSGRIFFTSDDGLSFSTTDLRGATGATGAQGPVGNTGPQGPIGNTGAQGPIGNTGAQGPAGPTGPQGPVGNTGPQGPIGNTGAQGPAGPTGSTGPQGPAGPDGSTDLSYTASTRTIASSTGTNATLPNVAAGGNSGLMTGADKTKLNNIEAGATADQTAAEIRTLVGSASDSNVFTDADHTKLNGIESGATADQTKADIDALNIDADTLDGQHGSYYRNAGNLNTGTIPDARLPGTISSDITGSSASCTGNAATATNADQLDGQHGSYYRNAGNLNTGTISDARLPATISSNITGSSASCTGNASTATTATNATNARIDHDTGNAWHRPVFIDDDKATATNQRLKTDNESTIGFNPSENKIRATTFVGTLNGNAVTASTSTNCGRSVISGSGLTGGGTLSQDRTLNVGQGSGINVTADSVHVDSTVLRTTGDQTISNTKTFNGRVNIRGNIDLSDNQYLDFGSSDDVSIHFSSNGWLYYNLKQNGIVFQDNGADRIILEDSGIIRPSGNNTGTIGTSSRYWDNGYFQDFNISNNLTVSNKINVGSSDNGHAIEVDRSASYSTHLYIGGWSSSNSSNIARIRCSSNLHIDGPSNGSCYINWYATNKNIYLGNTGQNVFAAGTNKVWHAGNDGSGSGLDADTVDGIQGGSFLRSDANDTATGTITFNGVANFRSAIDLADNDILRLGSGDDAELFFNGSHLYLDLNAGNLNIRENTTTRYTLNRNGTLSLVNLQASERVRAGNGTQNNAAFKFNGDDDTGMYRIGTNHMALITGGNRRHQIQSSGQQIFSAQGAPTRAHIFKTAQGSSTNRYIISGYRSSSRADQADGAEVFRVRTTGGVQNTANQYTSLSDERLKENIVDAQSQWDDVKALRLVNFNFIEDVGFGPEKLLGFIAQEVEEICPQLVDTDDLDDEEAMVPGQKSVKNSIIMTKGFGALQEAMARIEQLEARIAALEAQ